MLVNVSVYLFCHELAKIEPAKFSLMAEIVKKHYALNLIRMDWAFLFLSMFEDTIYHRNFKMINKTKIKALYVSI